MTGRGTPVANLLVPTLVGVNQAPTLSAIANPAAIYENAGAQTVELGGITPGPSTASGNTVTVTNSGSDIYTQGDYSRGILAQSLGGGGGDGGFSVAGGISNSPNVNLSVGGSGSSGGDGMEVDVDSSSNITTHGYDSQGIYAQSVGGGGGDGGFSIAGGITKSGTSVSVSIGGFGGGGGSAGDVYVGKNTAITGTIVTTGSGSAGIMAQSIGGGGGNGGMAIAGAIATQAGSKSLAFSLGGFGGSGNTGGNVSVISAADIGTGGDNSDGILAHSVGGGGGTGCRCRQPATSAAHASTAAERRGVTRVRIDPADARYP